MLACYFTQWARGRDGIGKYTANDVPSDLCTHIIFAFVNLENGKLKPFDNVNDVGMYTTEYVNGMNGVLGHLCAHIG